VGIVAAAQRAALRDYRRLGVTCELAVFDRGLSLGAAVPLDPESGVRERSSLGSWSSLSSGSGKSVEPGRSVGTSAPNEPNGLNELNELNESPPIFPPGVAFTRGDMRSLHVAAASLVAKVTRDHLMERLDRTFPGFGFAQHKGYGTERHVHAIAAQGPSPVHRRTFLHRPEGPESQSC
ncbi:MAG: hypothetical protein NTV92_05400, partial [Candidatus Bipolaricaulota bacterium]|nr:hypothetical protein [Candidatus Bipolaricaulota bacterium]